LKKLGGMGGATCASPLHSYAPAWSLEPFNCFMHSQSPIFPLLIKPCMHLFPSFRRWSCSVRLRLHVQRLHVQNGIFQDRILSLFGVSNTSFYNYFIGIANNNFCVFRLSGAIAL
jgi:hypothetical protein